MRMKRAQWNISEHVAPLTAFPILCSVEHDTVPPPTPPFDGAHHPPPIRITSLGTSSGAGRCGARPLFRFSLVLFVVVEVGRVSGGLDLGDEGGGQRALLERREVDLAEKGMAQDVARSLFERA